MSFSGTPLGQGRRLDHNTFLGKPPSIASRAPSPHHIIPTSYAYGAPVLGSRSPPKPSSPAHERNPSSTILDPDEQDEPALARYARLKQREQASSTTTIRPGGSTIITEPPKPDKWSVKDTSVNIATAFQQAASDMQPIGNSSQTWASGPSRPNATVPRSTSVEYEKETQSTAARRLALPPNRLAVPRNTTAGRKPLSKSASVRHVPDSEGEEEPTNRYERGKSPFDQLLDVAKRALGPATFYVRQRSVEPEEPSMEQRSTNGDSYDYVAEEQEFQASAQSRRATNITHKRGRMSTDNKAYKPSVSDIESSDEDLEDDGKVRRRKKKKKEPLGGPLTSLPVLTQDKKKKKKKAGGSKGNLAGADEEGSESDEQVSDRHSAQLRASIPRGSAPPPSRNSVPRGSMPPELSHDTSGSADIEQGLDLIDEVDEGFLPPSRGGTPHRSPQQQQSARRPFSVGGFLGSGVHSTFSTFRAIGSLILHILSGFLFICGRILGTIFDIILNRPLRWALNVPGPAASLGKYFILALTILSAWWFLQDPVSRWIPRFSSSPVYHAPEIPAANIAELSVRLQRIETALSGLSLDSERSRTKADKETKHHADLAERMEALESRIRRESERAVEAEVQVRKVTSQGLAGVKHEMEVLQAQIQAQKQQQPHPQSPGGGEGIGKDEEARSKLKLFEERLGNVEGGVREALDIGKKIATGPGVSSSAGAAWWNKLASGSAAKTGLTIKSADGQDVTALIGHLVDSAVSTYGKDTLARPDFALHSGGARIIPSLTSPTFEIRPSNLRSQLIGLVTGNGYAIGRPPITALHHELHNGHCWPFAGPEGQLGVALAAPTYITDISIDHVAKEVAFDMRSAPRKMEVWGMVEGKDNIVKVREWMAEKTRRRDEAAERGEVVLEEEEAVYPETLPKSPQYIRLAHFSYDIHAPHHVQTFPVSQEIQALGVDVGIVVLMVKSNWGREEFTCLYRMRVHGQRMGETPLPYPEDELA